MVTVVAVDVRVQRAGVDDQGDDGTSLARISSIRSEMSSWPLAPAAAASSLRRARWPPRWAAIASRVSSDTVVPRRCASCRSRASSSSGSFTVVRCMYASISVDQLGRAESKVSVRHRQRSSIRRCAQNARSRCRIDWRPAPAPDRRIRATVCRAVYASPWAKLYGESMVGARSASPGRLVSVAGSEPMLGSPVRE